MDEAEQCSACKEENKTSDPVCYCKDCKEFLCKEHFEEHQSTRFTKNHVTESVSEGIVLQMDLPSTPSRASAEQAEVHEIAEQFHDHLKIENVDTELQEMTFQNQCRPGKPECQCVTADTISLAWDRPARFSTNDVYQLCFKSIDDQASRWKPCIQVFKENKAKLQDFKSDTTFLFRVRAIYGNDEEGPYSQTSEPIKTQQSPAIKLMEFAPVVDKTSVPEICSLPITYVDGSKNSKTMSQKFEFGPSDSNIKGKEKTIMLVGETGTGKSTMLDGMVNYILGVNFDDPVRYTIVHTEDSEGKKQPNQSLCQTDWITCYTIYPMKGSRLDYTLTIIDTPGFGDTRGIKRDKQLAKQFHAFFSCRDARGILNIDAICFLVKAPDARLTPTQTYILESIMSLFGKNVERNICSLITFSDAGCPPVLTALKVSELPFGSHFTFNNSALFTNNKNLGPASLSPIYWDIGAKSFCSFFVNLEKMHPTSLEQTKDVLDTRQNLETTIQNLLPMVDVGLSTLSSMRQNIELIKQQKLNIEQNKEFLIPREYAKVTKHDTKPGQFVTNCMQCHFTCHENCIYSDNADKTNCSVISGSYCTKCPNKCHWTNHKNIGFYFKHEIEVKLESFADNHKLYEEASKKKVNCEGVVKEMVKDISKIKKEIDEMTTTITSYNNKLREIAIRLNPLSLVEKIELLIASELSQKRKGFEDRVQELELYKKEAQYGKVVDHFKVEESSVSAEVAEHVVDKEPGNEPGKKAVKETNLYERMRKKFF